MTWRVMRHSGRRRDQFRPVYEGDESKARQVYEREAARMRQGTVALVGPDGKAVRQTYAPCLRTRW